MTFIRTQWCSRWWQKDIQIDSDHCWLYVWGWVNDCDYIYLLHLKNDIAPALKSIKTLWDSEVQYFVHHEHNGDIITTLCSDCAIRFIHFHMQSPKVYALRWAMPESSYNYPSGCSMLQSKSPRNTGEKRRQYQTITKNPKQ